MTPVTSTSSHCSQPRFIPPQLCTAAGSYWLGELVSVLEARENEGGNGREEEVNCCFGARVQRSRPPPASEACRVMLAHSIPCIAPLKKPTDLRLPLAPY
ncbi:hypothetical protein DPEC_G00352270 [Dallia pectoralis]|uniref:Uncharacterized protein n=1 Tax=Dallia pectoralis TaxID=75939 RepID=A0ACC2F253_DALPE|nr:hypothetical protein DPEC_G00352270 [Dallia pectoralis]